MEKKNTKEICCAACGGRLEQKTKYVCQCTSCGRGYYTSTSRLHRFQFRLSVKNLILLLTTVVIAVATIAIIGYQIYTGQLIRSASRFSTAYRDFLLEVYDMPVADIGDEELAQIKYLKIEKESAYLFTYSFEDYYDYEDVKSFEQTLETVVVKVGSDSFDPANLQYFTGLTKVELYTGAWQNYVLPKNNSIRSICCKNGYSKIGTPEFFSEVNPDTIEDVTILDAKELDSDVFLGNLKNVKSLSLQYITIEDAEVFVGFNQLEELTLNYPVIREGDAYEIVEDLLQIPTLEKLSIEGKTFWYLTDEEWQYLQDTYGEKVIFERI